MKYITLNVNDYNELVKFRLMYEGLNVWLTEQCNSHVHETAYRELLVKMHDPEFNNSLPAKAMDVANVELVVV